MAHDDIPPRLTRDLQRPITDQQALFRFWAALMGPLGFTRAMLWLCFIASDNRPTPFLTQVDELPELPDDEPLLINLMHVARRVLDDQVQDGSLAVLLSRPGSGQVRDSDIAWARGLSSASREARVPLRPLHLATDEELRAFALDDLLGPDAA